MPAPATSSARNPRRILFADDKNAQIQALALRRHLKYSGFETELTTANTTQKAIHYVQTQYFDIIIVDLRFDNSKDDGNAILQCINRRALSIVFSGHLDQLQEEYQEQDWVKLIKRTAGVGFLAHEIGRTWLAQEPEGPSYNLTTDDEPEQDELPSKILELEVNINDLYKQLKILRAENANEREIADVEDRILSLRNQQRTLSSQHSQLLLDTIDPDDLYTRTEELLSKYEDPTNND